MKKLISCLIFRVAVAEDWARFYENMKKMNDDHLFELRVAMGGDHDRHLKSFLYF